MENRYCKDLVYQWTMRSYREKLFAGTSGNISLMDREAGCMYITPTSVDYEKLRPEDIVAMDLRGTVLNGALRPSSEWRLHAAVYRDIPDTAAVLHTHSPFATSFAVNRKAIPAALVEVAAFLGGEIPVAEFAMPGTEQVGAAAVRALRDRRACLLANHGVVAVGETLERAYTNAVYVEDAAKICVFAAVNGSVFEIDRDAVSAIYGK